MSTRIALVGGGTGGHFYPLMAIAEAVREKTPDAELYYFGPEKYDADALTALNIRYRYCPAGKVPRYISFLKFVGPVIALWGTFVAIVKLFIVYPDVVMSKGGYTSVPVVLAAAFLRIPIVIHESDAVVGRANKLAKRFARYIAISYAEAAQFFPEGKTALTGIPIRKQLLAPSSPEDIAALGVDGSVPLILVIGGSQGAERINTLVLESLAELLPHYVVVHQTGKQNHASVVTTAETLITDQNLLQHYHPIAFLTPETLGTAYNAAAIVISRAGSTVIFEIALHGKPSIIIPIPEEISHDQRSNAYAYASSGAASVLEEGNLHAGLLTAEIGRIMGDQTLYTDMSTAARGFAPADAAAKIADILANIGAEHGS
ncbi:hypothetical protein GW943_01675 [Candidatus Parcubacteria bacterium]|uniref:UDP-N-acetylglucosamine--N-acetylmuramyl-(pentapeptide) pyrophosphoryl-undecaprenol N-acetylglucosamine transferase n=1 Tax=Candidatus Kaiserbacteria bacterium CG10_big_fil_rev_8_21_14_0_10_47_16 TaxID=1974608 RepID=A0A2H0UEB5_9BACT|nr:hypothetical protein [Candidatus Parcubacteria bacterium]PIR84742.1 MAG: hypothetical protein COU16_00970 [Candidatus Kaiserbacteria bacterium CG10_big_fil_rev_8_21_14_0_10_47_16]